MKRAAPATAGTTRAVALLILLALHRSTSPALAADGPELLRWKLEPGREVRYILSQETIFDSTPEGAGKVHSERRQEVDLRWVVGEVAEGAADVDLVVDRLRARESRDGLPAEFAYDTAAESPPAGDVHAARMVAMLKAVAGARISFHLTPRGEVHDVRLPDELAASLRRPDATGGVAMGSEEAVRNLIVPAMPFLPEGPSGSGTTWTRQLSAPMPMLGSLILDKTYTDRGPRAGRPEIHDVDVETRFTLRPMPGSTVKTELVTQSGVGSFAFDARRGLVESARLEDSLTLRLSADGRKVEQSVSTRLELKLAPAAAPAP